MGLLNFLRWTRRSWPWAAYSVDVGVGGWVRSLSFVIEWGRAVMRHRTFVVLPSSRRELILVSGAPGSGRATGAGRP